MKKIAGIILLILITATFGACGQGKDILQTENIPTWQDYYDLGV